MANSDFCARKAVHSAEAEVRCLGVAVWMAQPERVVSVGVGERSYGRDDDEEPHREPSQDVMVTRQEK